MAQLYYTNLKQLEEGDISLLKEVHVNSSGLKALTTGVTSDGIEVCRKCCGGHGYSRFSGLIDLYGNYVPACTYEGDNTIMLLQTARELVHVYNTAHGIRHPHTSAELTKKKTITAENLHPSPPIKTAPSSLQALYGPDDPTGKRSTIASASDCLALRVTGVAFHHRARRLLSNTCTRLNGLVKQGGHSFEVAYEKCKVDLVRCARAHCWMLIHHNFMQALGHVRDATLMPVLTNLARLFALSWIEREMGDFTEDGFIDERQAELVRSQVRELLSVIRVDAVAIVDSFDFSDHYLNSALGKWDGNVYDTLYTWARTANPMNDSDIAPGVERILLPIMKNGRKLAEQLQSKDKIKAKL